MSISSWAGFLCYPLVFASIAVASFIPAEAVFRLLGDAPSEDLRGLYAPFGDNGYKLGANVDTSASWASGPFFVHTDGLGLRCDRDRRFAVHPGDLLDVVFLGDSQGFGNGVSFESTIAGTVAACEYNRQLRVANISVGGHTITQQLELLQRLVTEDHLRARTYVLLTTPVMALGCDGYTHAAVGADGRLYDGPKTAEQMAVIYLKSHSVTYSRIRDAIRNIGIGLAPPRDTPFLFRLYDAGVDEQRVTNTLTHCVQQLTAFADTQRANLAMVYVPLTVEAGFSDISEAAASHGIRLDPDLPSRIAASVSRRLGVPFLDLRPVARDLRANGDPLHLKGDYHYDATLSSSCGKRVGAALSDLPRRSPSAAASRHEES